MSHAVIGCGTKGDKLTQIVNIGVGGCGCVINDWYATIGDEVHSCQLELWCADPGSCRMLGDIFTERECCHW